MSAYTVLVIDDDAVDRLALRRALTSAVATIEVREAPSAERALELLEAGGIDCAIMDDRLPDMDGLTLLAEVRRRRIDVPVIALTGRGDEKLAVELMKAGAVDYLAKEWLTSDRLERSLRHAAAMLEAARLQAELFAREQAARREAEQASRAKDQFLAHLSHELRTPLSAITGWTHLLGTGTLDAPATAGAVASIERNAQRLSSQIDNLLDLTRIAAGTLVLDLRPADLVTITQSVIAAEHETAAARDVRIDCYVSGQPRPVNVDVQRLKQTIAHLLSNAIKFSKDGGVVEVGIAYHDAAVRISVRDDGAGIDPHFLPNVFSAFHQADTTNTRRHGGLGLGLSMVQQIVSLHGGSVSATSEGTGTGATFTVVLPAAPDTNVAAVKNGGMLSGIRVLVVDDDEDAQQLIAALLRRRGAEVLSVGTAEQARARYREFDPHVLLSDVSMPDEDGLSLIESIRAEERRARRTRLPAAAVTALTLATDRSKALTAGFDVHVPKPINPDQLTTLVATLASGSGTKRS